jgi:hypothetical protein
LVPETVPGVFGLKLTALTTQSKYKKYKKLKIKDLTVQ